MPRDPGIHERALNPAERTSLLERYAPLLRFDSLECLRPVEIDEYLKGSVLVDEDGVEVPADGIGPAMLAQPGAHDHRLNPLPGDTELNSDRRSNLLLETFGGVQDPSDAGTCYGRVVEQARWIFLQYWFFYVDNPYVLAPGRHDGDWEMIQLGLSRKGDDFEAARITFAQHGQGHSLELKPGKRPEVYVAIGSHAAYPSPNTKPRFPVADECDARQAPADPPRVIPLPEKEPAKDWRYWKGRWGMDRGLGTWLALRLHLGATPGLLRGLNSLGVGDSPASPGWQGVSWRAPWRFQGYGTVRRNTTGLIQRVVHFIGRLTWPRAKPDVVVDLSSDGAFSITVRPVGWLLRRVIRVMVNFERAGSGKAVGLHTVRAGRTTGRLEHADGGPIAWRAAGYNLLRQRGYVIGSQAVEGDGAGVP